MKRSAWAQATFERVQHHPEYLTAKMVIDITEQICQRMEEKNISQRQLAALIDKPQSYISRLFSQGNNVTIKTLVTIADALDAEFTIPRLVDKNNVELFAEMNRIDLQSVKMMTEDTIMKKRIRIDTSRFHAVESSEMKEKNNGKVALAS